MVSDTQIYSIDYVFTLQDTYRLMLYVDTQDTVVGLCFSHSEKSNSAFRAICGTHTSIVPHPAPRTLPILQELDAYFNGRCAQFTVPYRYITGTAFQMAVWRHIAIIAPDSPLSYTDIAQKICTHCTQRTLPVRAVGTATGANPLPILIPCHRVLPKQTVKMWVYHKKIKTKIHKHVGNYRGGTTLKQQLLELEAKYYY